MPPLVLTPDGRSYRVTGGFSLALCLDDDHHPAANPAESLIMPVNGTPYRRFRILSGCPFRASAPASERGSPGPLVIYLSACPGESSSTML